MDVTDLTPVLKLLELKNSDEKKYKETLKGIEDVTRDLIEISVILTNEQREKQQKELKEKMAKELHSNKPKEKIVKNTSSNDKEV